MKAEGGKSLKTVGGEKRGIRKHKRRVSVVTAYYMHVWTYHNKTPLYN
jgi:hypothetical protein